jgi:hypothetical protein
MEIKVKYATGVTNGRLDVTDEAPSMPFEQINEDLWMSKKIANKGGNWPYFLFIELIDWEDATGDLLNNGHRYVVGIHAVAPRAVNKANMIKAADIYIGHQGQEAIDKLVKNRDQVEKAKALREYGILATLWENTGDNDEALLEEAKKKATEITVLFGFFMDKQMNAIGNTGWDFISGNIGFNE